MEDFSGWMSSYQAEWRRKHITCPESGRWRDKQYEWILLPELWEETLWPSIRTGAEYPLADYLEREKIRKHNYVHNLKSSWTQCANMYFLFGQTEHGRELLAGFLKTHVSGEVESVDALELEHEEPDDLSPSVLLGEKGGKRGIGQTSPDLGFVVNGGRGLILTENKLTESSFGVCSAKFGKGRKLPPNPHSERCKNPSAGLDAATQCHQVAWGRKYREHLAPVANREALSKLRCCPAARSGYQLFRQQALAQGIANSGKYDFVVSSVAMDMRNETLLTCLKSTKIADVREWGSLFNGRAQFKVFDHQQWVNWVQTHDTSGTWADWLRYVKGRYGYSRG